jgi:hypothetical protein
VDGKLVVCGTTSDNGAVTEVLVNGREAHGDIDRVIVMQDDHGAKADPTSLLAVSTRRYTRPPGAGAVP